MVDQKSVDVVLVALVIWREARGESSQGKLGVAAVIRNRAAMPGWWGNDVMSVCVKPWQFTSMTGAGDANLIKWPKASDTSWQQSLAAAEMMLTDGAADPTSGATHYHDVSIEKPTGWGDKIEFITQIGKLKFYKETA